MKATLYGLTKNKNDIHVKSQLEKMLAQVSEEGAAVIDGANIAAESIYGKSIVAGSIEATQIKAGAITSDHITANGIVADKIKTGILRSTNGASWLNLNDGTFSYANGNFTFQNGKMVVRAHTIELGGEEVPTKTQTEQYTNSLGETLQGQIDTSIKSTEVEYYSSTSSTSPVGGSWSTTAPAWQEGRFMWSRTKITPNKGSIIYKPNATGTNISGATGSSAKIVTVTPSAQLFWRNQENAVTPATITVDGSVQNTTISAWQYSVDGGSFTTTLPAGVTRSGNKVSLTGANITARTIAVKALDASGNTDTTTIAMVQDGAKGVDGSSGPKGENAIVGILTNESITVPASESGAVTSFTGATGTFEIYDGITRKTGSGVTYSVSGTPSGITVSINATTGIYTISAMTGGTSVLSGNATLQAVYNGVTIQKVLTVTKAMTGKTGATGSTGASGSDAKIVTLTSSAQIFAKNADGVISPASITVEGVSQNTSITTWEYSVDGGTFSSTLPTGLSRTGNVVSITGSSVTAKSISLRAKDASGVSDVLSIAVVQDGAKGDTGAKGATGADAYTVVLSNEAHTFVGNTASAIASSVTVNVVAYKGATRVGATIGTISGAVAGMSTSIATNGTTTASFTVSVTTAMSTTNGLLTIPITVDGKVFSKTFSFALALKGADGANGSAGADAKVIIVNPSAQIFTKDANGNVAPSTITVDGTAQNVTISTWEYSIEGGAFSTSLPTGLTRSGNKVTITGSSMTAKNISVRASGGGVSDTTTIAMVQDGAKGSTGSTGAKGDNSIVGYLTNESVTLGASSTGVVSSFATASGTFRVFDGITEVTTNSACVFSLNSSTGVTVTINSSGVYTVTAMSTDTATAEFKAVYKGITITKALSLSKSRVGETGSQGPKGATGSQGPKGDIGTSVESVTEYYLATSASSGVTTSTSGWTTSIQTMTATNKYLWNYEKINFSDGTDQPTIPVIIGAYGDKGQTGSTGATGRSITGITEHYLASSAATGVTRTTSGWTTTMQQTDPTKKYLWNYETITWSSGTTTTYVEPIVIGIHGEQGPQGPQGIQGPKGATGSQGPQGNVGVGVSSITEHYLATTASSGVTTATSGWTTTMQEMTATNKYLWNYEKINFSDGTNQPTIPVIIGVYGDKGQTGSTGATGATGRSITGITEHYLATSSATGVTRSTSGWSTSMQTTTPTKKYLWNYETVTWSSGTSPTYVDPIIIGIHGEQGLQGPQGPQGATGSQGPRGATGTSVESITEYYLATSASSGILSTNTGFTTTMQPLTETNKYLWNYEKINFSDGTSQPTIPVIIGVYGDKGQTGATGSTGATGRSITSITEHYLATSANSGVTRSTSGWGTTMQPTTETNKYLWNYETINWSSGTTPTYVEPIIIGVHGAKGATGAKGADGISPIVGFLTNESITLPASSAGAVSSFTGATGTFEVYDGTTRKTGSGVTYSVSGTPSGITVSINATTGVYTVSAMTTGASVLSGTATLRAVYGGVTIDKILVVTKALAGSQGATGATGATGSTGATGPAGQNATSYWINASVNAIKKDVTGNIVPNTITFSGFSKTGTSNPVAYSGRFIVQTSTDGTSYTPGYTSGANQSSYTYTIPTDSKFVKARLYLAGGTSVLLDEQTIPVLVDAEGIKIGGRNLILNSQESFKVEYSGTAEHNRQYNVGESISVPLIIENEYTLSLRARGNIQIMVYRISTTGNSSIPFVEKSEMSETEYRDFSLTFKPHKDELTAIYLTTGYNTGISGWYEIEEYSLKLEKGNKATDWTPAPEDVTAEIKSVNTQALDAAKQAQLVSPFISGTQTGTTGNWTGNAPFDALVDGQQITYWLPTSPSSNASLNLTLSNGTSTGAVNCYYSGTTRLTTHYAAGNVIRLTYRENILIGSTRYTGWWADANYVDGNNYDRTRYNTSITAKSAVSAGRIIVSDDVGFFHLAKGSSFDYTKPILYAASAIASGGTQTNNYTTYPAFTLRNNDSGITLTSGKAVYLKGSLNGTTFTVNSSTLFTDSPDNDGSVYLLLGQMQTTVNVLMYPNHDLYQFSQGVFKSFAQIASESSTMIEAWRMPDKVTINGGMLEAGTVSAYHLVVGSGEVGERNLSRGIVASGDYTGSVATDGNKAVGSTYATFGDGNRSGVGPEGSYLQVDLGSTFKVAQSQVYFYSADNRNYWYKIKYSVDGTRWFYAVGTEDNDGWVASPPRTNGASLHPTVDTFAPLPITARFVRLYGNGNNINSTNHIYEWELYESPQTRIYGDQIETGRIKSANGVSWIDLDNGRFNFASGGLVYDSTGLTLNGKLSVGNLQGQIAKSQLDSTTQSQITAGNTAQSTLSSKASTWDAKMSDADVANKILADKKIIDTRATNQNPAWYFSNYPNQIVREFKNVSAMTVGTGTYGILTTDVPWSSNSGGSVKQTFRTNTEEFKRDGTSTSWTAWVNHDAMAAGAKTLTDKWAFTGKTTINGGQIEADTIKAAQIAANTITATQIASRTITTDRIVANAITANEIAAGTITATEIKSRTITTDRIATNAITANEINVANLSALSANLGNVTAGTIKSTNGLIDINLNTGVVNLGQPLTINAKPVATKEDVDSISVGGRNLLKDTSDSWLDAPFSLNGYNSPLVGLFDISDYGLEVGDTVTLSLEIETPAGKSVMARFEQYLDDANRETHLGNKVDGKGLSIVTTKISANRPKFRVMVQPGITPAPAAFVCKVRKMKLERGNIATDWTPAPEDVEAQISGIETRVSNAELSITPESITATVVESEDLTSKLQGYATQESLGNYISSDDFSTEKENIIGEIDSRIGAIDYSPFVQATELEQKTDALTAKISQAGGVNLIQNSIGWAGKDFWSNFSATAGVSIQNEELASMGFGSGWYSESTGLYTQKQRLTLPRSGTYTLSFWLKKTVGSSWAFVQIQKGDDTTFSNSNAFAYAGYSGARLTDGYELFTTTFEATELDVAVSITINTGVEATITGIMLHEGSEPFKWQPYTSEVYNTNVKMDMNGITVKNNADAGYTLITPDEFSGYAPVDGTVERVFTLNGDTTEVKKLKAEQQFQMAPVTIITIDNSKYSGWAFI